MALGVATAVGLAVVSSTAWGQDLTTQLSYFLVDLRAGALGVNQPISTLRATGSISVGAANPAQTGLIRVPNNATVFYARNQANNGDVPFVYLDTNNIWNVDANAVGVLFTPTTFASLGTPANGVVKMCSDCTIANPCAGAGTGAFAKRLNGVWVCN